MKKILILSTVILITAIVGALLDSCIIGDALSSLPRWKKIAHFVELEALGFIIGGTVIGLYKPWAK